MRHGKQPNLEKYHSPLTSVRTAVVAFVIGKHGVRTGGIGDIKTTPSTKGTSQMQLCYSTITTNRVVQLWLNCVSQEMRMGV